MNWACSGIRAGATSGGLSGSFRCVRMLLMACGSRMAEILLAPPRVNSLEQAIEYVETDELVEVTPKNIRIRKKYLGLEERRKSNKKPK